MSSSGVQTMQDTKRQRRMSLNARTSSVIAELSKLNTSMSPSFERRSSTDLGGRPPKGPSPRERRRSIARRKTLPTNAENYYRRVNEPLNASVAVCLQQEIVSEMLAKMVRRVGLNDVRCYPDPTAYERAISAGKSVDIIFIAVGSHPGHCEAWRGHRPGSLEEANTLIQLTRSQPWGQHACAVICSSLKSNTDELLKFIGDVPDTLFVQMPIQQSMLRSMLLSALSMLKCRAASKTKDSLKDSLIRHLGSELKELRKQVQLLEEQKKNSDVAKAANKMLGRRRRSSVVASSTLHANAAAAATSQVAVRKTDLYSRRRRASIGNDGTPGLIRLSLKQTGGPTTSPINTMKDEPRSPLKLAADAASAGVLIANDRVRSASCTRNTFQAPLDVAGDALKYLKSMP